MAGLIDFSLLGRGIDIAGAANNFVKAYQASAENKIARTKFERQTKIDARADLDYERGETQRQGIADAMDPTTGKLDPEKMRRVYAENGDAKGLLDFEKTQAAARTAQMEDGLKRLSAIARVAGAAVDQESYTRSLEEARSLNLDVSQLPPQFDPKVVQEIRYRALDEKDRVELEFKGRKFDLDAADREADNVRADRSLDVREDRSDRDFEYRRARDDRRERRLSQPRQAPAPRNPTASGVMGRLLDKVANGGALTSGEQQAYDLGKQRTGGRAAGGYLAQLSAGAPVAQSRTSINAPPRSAAAPPSAPASAPPTATDPSTGAKVMFDGRAWVPVR